MGATGLGLGVLEIPGVGGTGTLPGVWPKLGRSGTVVRCPSGDMGRLGVPGSGIGSLGPGKISGSLGRPVVGPGSTSLCGGTSFRVVTGGAGVWVGGTTCRVVTGGAEGGVWGGTRRPLRYTGGRKLRFWWLGAARNLSDGGTGTWRLARLLDRHAGQPLLLRIRTRRSALHAQAHGQETARSCYYVGKNLNQPFGGLLRFCLISPTVLKKRRTHTRLTITIRFITHPSRLIEEKITLKLESYFLKSQPRAYCWPFGGSIGRTLLEIGLRCFVVSHNTRLRLDLCYSLSAPREL